MNWVGDYSFEKGEAADGSDDVLMGGCAACLRRYNIDTDSSFQNPREFVGAIVGLLVAIRHVMNMWGGLSAVLFREDSVTALR